MSLNLGQYTFRAAPVFFYGKWRATIRLKTEDFKETLGCARLYTETVPRLN